MIAERCINYIFFLKPKLLQSYLHYQVNLKCSMAMKINVTAKLKMVSSSRFHFIYFIILILI